LNKEILFIKHHLSHLGKYSGYENFIPQLAAENIHYATVQRVRSLQRFDFWRRRYIINKKKQKKRQRLLERITMCLAT